MWDRFGEFNSAEELNVKAAELKKEGKLEDVKNLAEENGIDKDMAEMFIEGEIDFLCDVMQAAEGKLSVEISQYEKSYVANAIEVAETLHSMFAMEKIKRSVHKAGVDIDIDCTGEELANAIRQKGKVLNNILKDVFTKCQKIHREGTPASILVIPMVINEYLRPVREKKTEEGKK